MRSLVLLASLALFSCSTPGTKVHADTSKLRPWSEDLQSEQPMPPPYVADFEAGSRALCYTAIQHSSERDSPSLSLLQQVMDRRRFGMVVLEGIPRSMGISPVKAKEEAERDGKEGYFRNGETSIAIARAEAKKIPFVGAEPDDGQIRDAVMAAGFSQEDLFGFYVLQLVPQWRSDGTFTRETFEEAFAQASPVVGSRVGIPQEKTPSATRFRAWYEGWRGSPFRPRDVRPETTAPVPDGTMLSQKIALVIDRVRSVHILQVTEEMLNRYGRVLLVFNSVHFPVQEPALESMLGKPVRISDQP